MPLVKNDKPVEEKAVQTAQAEVKKEVIAEPEPELHPHTHVEEEAAPVTSTIDEPELEEVEPEVVQEATQRPANTEVAQVSGNSAVAKQTAQNQALAEMAEQGIEGLGLDYTSFPNVVLKDGEFQIVGTNKVMDAVKGFDAIITKTQAKFAMKVGTNDDDGDVVFSADKADFENPNTEVGQKVAEWRAEGLKPELKKYIEAFCMVETVHGDEQKELEGELVVVQVAPMSCGRFSGYVVTQQAKRKALPPEYVTHVKRGEKVTSAKFPFYPWDFKFVRMA